MNVTLSIDEEVVRRARELAAQRGTSLNGMIRELLEEATSATSRENMLAELEGLWINSGGHSDGSSWTREDLYDRPILR